MISDPFPHSPLVSRQFLTYYHSCPFFTSYDFFILLYPALPNMLSDSLSFILAFSNIYTELHFLIIQTYPGTF